jgi:hypothetical protein
MNEKSWGTLAWSLQFIERKTGSEKGKVAQIMP